MNFNNNLQFETIFYNILCDDGQDLPREEQFDIKDICHQLEQALFDLAENILPNRSCDFPQSMSALDISLAHHHPWKIKDTYNPLDIK